MIRAAQIMVNIEFTITILDLTTLSCHISCVSRSNTDRTQILCKDCGAFQSYAPGFVPRIIFVVLRVNALLLPLAGYPGMSVVSDTVLDSSVCTAFPKTAPFSLCIK